MKCPHCNEEVKLSWSMYFKYPFVKFICTKYNEKFKIKCYLKLFVVFLFSAVLYLISVFSYTYYNWQCKYFWFVYLLITATYFGVYIPLDKRIKSKCTTRKI